MRYYNIVITDPTSGQVVQPNSLSGAFPGSTYTSMANGQTNPSALNIELDAPVFGLGTPVSNAFVRVWGVSLAEIGQANDLRGKNISVFAGMQKGLPLAKPALAGLILKGYVLKAFGNWVDTSQTLDLVVAAGDSPNGLGTPDAPRNLIHDWPKGTKLGDAITNTIKTAFPGYTSKVNVSDKLVLPEDDKSYYHTVGEYAAYLIDESKRIIGGSYQGVRIVLRDKEFNVYDGTSQSTPVKIAFEDMIGQPTWIDTLTLQFKCPIRADLHVGDFITMPPAAVTTTAQGAIPSGVSLRASSIFQGTFQIGQMRHVGNFRQPDPNSWVTTFDAYSTQVT